MKKNLFIATVIILALSGCKKTTELPQEAPRVLETASHAAPEQARAPAVVSGEQGWYRITRDAQEIMRCFDKDGCIDGKKRVMNGAEKRKGENGIEEVYCGSSKDSGIEFAAGYRCDPLSGLAMCAQDRCDCGETALGRGELCKGPMDGEAFAQESARFDPQAGWIAENPAGMQDAADADVSVPEAPLRTCGEEEGELSDDGMYAEFDCVEVYLEGTGGGCLTGSWVCLKNGGCKTKDGRLYQPLSRISKDSRPCRYHLVGDADTTLETMCRTGDCVLAEDADPSLKIVQARVYKDFVPEGYAVVDADASYDLLATFLKEYGDDYEYEGRLVIAEGFAVDASSCEGGIRYCHGKDNAPQPQPQDPDGYACEDTPFLPGHEIDSARHYMTWRCEKPEGCTCGGSACPENAMCSNEQCYCGTEKIDPAQDWKCEQSDDPRQGGTKICAGANCPCGTKNCQANTACEPAADSSDVQCTCGGKVMHAQGRWRCEHGSIGFDGKRDWRCADPSGCPCEGKTIPFNTKCVDGHEACMSDIDTLPGPKFACKSYRHLAMSGWFWSCEGDRPCSCYGYDVAPGQECNHWQKLGFYCAKPQQLTPDGCLCGTKPTLSGYECKQRPDGTRVNVCQRGDGCQCGNTRCQTGMYCIDGRCATPEIDDGSSAAIYWHRKIQTDCDRSVVCKDEDGCFCGSQKCPFGTFCLDDVCLPACYSFTRKDRRYSYSYDGEEYCGLNAMFHGKWIACNGWNDIPDGAQVDYANSDRIDDYYCDIARRPDAEEAYGECDSASFDAAYGPAGLTCPRPDYCMCGAARCPKDSTCACKLDDQYRLKCACEDRNAVYEYTDHTLGCGDSRIPEKQAGAYACDATLGFVCTQDGGCACGSVTCAQGAVCLAAGICTGVVTL